MTAYSTYYAYYRSYAWRFSTVSATAPSRSKRTLR